MHESRLNQIKPKKVREQEPPPIISTRSPIVAFIIHHALATGHFLQFACCQSCNQW
jgi:hypothetical protein